MSGKRKKKADPKKKTMSSRKKEVPSPQEGTLPIDHNATIECLLALRSVRDQFADAELDLLTGELADKLVSLEKSLIDHLAEQREHQDGIGILTVSVVGDFNSGKSTFINALLKTDVCPIGDEPTTASVTYFVHGDQERIEQKKADGKWDFLDKTEYDALASHKKEGDSEPHTFRISINSPVLDHIRLVDTPGFNAPPPNTNDTRVTEKAVMGADVLFVLMDANKGNPSSTLLDQLSRLSQNSTNQPIFLLLNKAESLPPSQRREVKHFCKENHGDRFRDVVLVSALRLNEAEDEEPLDALENAIQRMLSAYKERDSFQEKFSAKRTPQSYQFDISGNVYNVSIEADSELASHEQLAEMVKKVATERHSLLEQQFQLHTLQLRENWQTTLSELDMELKRELSENSSDGHHETKRKNALKRIEKAKSDMLYCIREICERAGQDRVAKGKRIERGVFWDTSYYTVIVSLNNINIMVMDDDNWFRINSIYEVLLSHLEKYFGINLESIPKPEEVVEKLKEVLDKNISKLVGEMRKNFRSDVKWESKRGIWQNEFEGDKAKATRNKLFKNIVSNFNSVLDPDIDQIIIYDLKQAITLTTQQNKSQTESKAEQLTKLQERINKMKEHSL